MGPTPLISNSWAIANLAAMSLLLIASQPYVMAEIHNPSPSFASEAIQKSSRSISTTAMILLGVCIMLGFILMYFRSCFPQNEERSRRPIIAMIMRRTGLDPAVIDTFLTMVYSDAKKLMLGKKELECAVCLSEFEDREILRLMPNCDHGFHIDCINIWLAQHNTCPVCRTDVLPRPSSSTNQAVLTIGQELNSPIVEVVVEENNRTMQQRQKEHEPRRSLTPSHNPSYQPRPIRTDRVIRSHSTGHFPVHQDEDIKQFSLRLPFEVRKQVMDRAAGNASSSRGGNRSSNGDNSRVECPGQPKVLDQDVTSDWWPSSRVSQYLLWASRPRSSQDLTLINTASLINRGAELEFHLESHRDRHLLT